MTLDALSADTAYVKTQATGPVTLGLAAMLAGGHPGGDDLWQCIVEGLVRRIEAHLEDVSHRLPNADVTLVLDEPALAAGPPGTEFGPPLEALGAVVDALGVRPGIHCCGDVAWVDVLRVTPSAISLDPAAIGRGFAESVDAIARSVSEGTRIIWGAVPTVPPPIPSIDLLVSRIRRIEGSLVMAGADLRALGDAWVSPACGLSGLTEEQALAVARRTLEVAEALH